MNAFFYRYRDIRQQNRQLNKHPKHTVAEAAALPKGNRLGVNSDMNKSSYYSDEKALIARLELDKRINLKDLRLDKKAEQIYNRNPHLREVFINDRRSIGISPMKFDPKDRFLDLKSPVTSYDISAPHDITTEHWGTRKLLLTDIEFLTQNVGMGKCSVIYIGAAPGLHINYLSELFPDLDFVLIDTQTIKAKKTSKIHFRLGDVVQNIVEEYAKSKKELLLICNVHTFGSQDYIEETILRDIKKQAEWHLRMKPIASLLTFRLPPKTRRIQFLEGSIVLQPWSSRRTSVCRLLVRKDARIKEYDVTTLKACLAHFQNVLRIMYYEHDLEDSNVDGLDHCYDCRSEIFILSQYLKKVQRIPDENKRQSPIAIMSLDISNNIHDESRPSIVSSKRTLNVIRKK